MDQSYLFPQTIEEALQMLASCQGKARIIAGGTDLVLQLQRKEVAADCLVDITRIPELQTIRQEGEAIILGACVTHAQVAASPLVRQRAPLLADACAVLGSPQIRNVGTIGGNIVNAQPAADSVIALLALDAQVEIANARRRRWEPLSRLFQGPGECGIDPGQEVLTGIRFAGLGPDEPSAFLRLARRRAMALPMLNVGVVVKVDQGDIPTFAWARIALGPVAPIPFRATRAEDALRHAPVTRESIARAAQIASEDAEPRSSLLRGSREYRKEMVRVYVRRALEQAMAPWLAAGA